MVAPEAGCSGERMTKLFHKILTGFLILIVVFAAVSALRADLLSGGAAYDTFVAVFDCFPFAKELAEIAANIGQYGITLQGLTPTNVFNDIAKVFAMSVVCPVVIGLTSSIFLRVPDYEDWYDRENHMNGIGYRLKECLLSVVMMPVCAYITAQLLDFLQVWLQTKWYFLSPVVVSIVLLVGLLGLSILVGALFRPMSMMGLVRHRLVVDLLGSLLKVLGMNFLCFFIALAILNGQAGLAFEYGILLFIYLAAIELMLGAVTGG